MSGKPNVCLQTSSSVAAVAFCIVRIVALRFTFDPVQQNRTNSGIAASDSGHNRLSACGRVGKDCDFGDQQMIEREPAKFIRIVKLAFKGVDPIGQGGQA
ncbi:MAG: hypothetical protein IPP85_07375 [Propionivibrio sp.]|nr:hypothetical protein [Propionivibrio sp.]